MHALSWVLLGLVAGVIAKLLVPGPDPGGWIVTIVIGIVGAAIGGFVGTQLNWGTVDGFDIRSIALSVGGAIILLLVLKTLQARRMV